MKKVSVLMSVLLGIIMLLSGCGKKEESKELHWMTNASGPTFEIYKELANEFEKESGIRVNVTTHGRDLEQLLRARIASDSLPDLFSTHGWSVARYGEYLEPLNNEKWFGDLEESAKSVMTDEAGKMFALPLTVEKRGIIANLTVLEEAGVDYKTITTWETFVGALEKIKAIEKTPFYIASMDPRGLALAMDVFAQGMFVFNHGDELIDGSFDWTNWNTMSEMLIEFNENGYFNKNILTADGDSYLRAFAQNNAAFSFEGGEAIMGILEYNPDVRLGIIPIPSFEIGNEFHFIGGEREAVGINKGGENKELAKEFLNFITQKEKVERIATANQNPTAFKGANPDLGMLQDFFTEFSTSDIYPYFDRAYLPGGMWSTLQIVGNGVLSGDVSIEEASNIMKEDYNRLR